MLGRAKQGKTERYRNLFRHLAQQPRSVRARAGAEAGLVMICFTLPSFEVVFKVIRDRIPEVKTCSKQGRHGQVQLSCFCTIAPAG